MASIYGPPSAAIPKKTKKQNLNQLIDQEWSELPYAMMRFTAARRPWDGTRLYWRDRTVQLGEIDLNLTKRSTKADAPVYEASYRLEDLRRDFTLQPSRRGDVLVWAAPGISGTAKLTTEQLAEKLLARLVIFYTTGLS